MITGIDPDPDLSSLAVDGAARTIVRTEVSKALVQIEFNRKES